MLNRFLFQKMDNSPLIIFRIFFGLIIAAEGFGAIATGWVRRTFVEAQFNFNFIGFEFLEPLPGIGMYVYFAIMGILGICIALGYKYRFSMIAFALMWWAVYLAQKTSYNNHYYLLALINTIMCFLPAHRSNSIDAGLQPEIKTNSMYAYVKWIIVLQLFIVYTYAAIAKLYGDWLDFTFLKLLLESKSSLPIIGDLLKVPSFQIFIGVSGILFDLLVVPALLWKPTRKIAFGLSILFHLFNSAVFHIGIFPYLALAFTVFFFEPETIRKIFFKKKAAFTGSELTIPSFSKFVTIVGGIYFFFQLVLPIRHHFIADDVLWTEEGHRLSWRMMLRSRRGHVNYKVVDKKTDTAYFINLKDYLTKKQRGKIGAYPDFIWQFAQHLKEEYAAQGMDVAVFADARVSINGRPKQPLIDHRTDLASEPWDHFRHHEWILPSPLDDQE